MAYVVDFVAYEETAAATSATPDLPEHQADDILLAFANKDTTGAISETSSSGWTLLQGANGSADWEGVWWKRATTSAETPPTFSWTTETMCAVTVTIRGAHTSTDPTAVIATADSSIPYSQNQAQTTGADNGLVVFGIGTDGGMGPAPFPGEAQVLYAGDAGANSMGVSWKFYPTSGTSTQGLNFFGAIVDSTRVLAVYIPDDGNNSRVDGYVMEDTGPILFNPLTGATLAFNGVTLTMGASNQLPMLGSDWDQVWTFNGVATYTDETVDTNDLGTGDVALTNAVGAILYLGSDTIFDSMAIDIGTAGTGSPVVVWEYWDGGAWTTFTFAPRYPTTFTTTFTVSGQGVYRFTPPDDWATTTVNGSASLYYIRQRVTTTWTAAPTLDQVLKNGRPLVFDIMSGAADSGVNPYWGSAVTSPTAAANSQFQYGGDMTLSAAQDWSSSILLMTFRYGIPRDFVDAGLYNKHKGMTVTLMDTGNDYKSWIIAAKDAPDSPPANRVVIGIQPAQAIDTAWAAQGTFNPEAIDTITPAVSQPFGATAAQWSMLMIAREATLAGGLASSPLGFVQTCEAFVNGSSLFPIIDRSGSAASVYNPLAIGGGDPVHVDINLRTFQFPTRASETDKTTQWHVDDDEIGIEFYGQAGDTVKFRSCVFTGETPYWWRMNASASASADWDFSGTTVAGATVTLRPVTTFTSMTFNNCSEITLNGADISNSTIRNTRAATSQGGIAFTSASESDGIDRITFVDNNDGDIGHSIRITATGTYTFDEHTFSGGGPAHFSFHTQTDIDPGADTVTKTSHGYSTGDAIYYQDQGGTDTIGLTDGNLYYVRAVSSSLLGFYTTKANANSDTSRIALSDGSGGETHYIYSAKADVYNNSGGAVTINITNGGDTPTIRNSNGSTTSVVTSVAVAVHVENAEGTDIESAQVFIRKSGSYYSYTSHNTNNSSGDATFEVNEAVDTDLPQTGWLHAWDSSTNTKQNYRYASWSGTSYTLNSEVTGNATSTGSSTSLVSTSTNFLSADIEEGDTIRNTTDGSWAVVDEIVDADNITTSTLQGGSDNTWQSSDAFSVHRLAITYDNTDLVDIPLFNGQTDASGDIATTFGGTTPALIVVRVRSNEGATKYVPFSTSGTITSSGYSLTVILTEDSVAT